MDLPSVPSAVCEPSSANNGVISIPVVPVSTGRSRSRPTIRRSRSGCFTCRVRRKKCDEDRPSCKACSSLGLKCDYKPPHWWATIEQRRQQKERIKNRIRQTKIMEKEGSLQEYMRRIHELVNRAPVTAEYNFSQPVFVEQPQSQLSQPFTAPLPTPVTAPLETPVTVPVPTPVPAPLSTPVTPHDANIEAAQETGVINSMPLQQEVSVSFNGPMNPVQSQWSTLPTPEVTSNDWYSSSTSNDNSNSTGNSNSWYSSGISNDNNSNSTGNSNSWYSSGISNDSNSNSTGNSTGNSNSWYSSGISNDNNSNSTGNSNSWYSSGISNDNNSNSTGNSNWWSISTSNGNNNNSTGNSTGNIAGNTTGNLAGNITSNNLNYGQAFQSYPTEASTSSVPALPAPKRNLSSCLRHLISVKESDRPLFDHFVDHVLGLVFPILEIQQGGSVWISEILNSMQDNRSYLHCCLSVSAIHLKASLGMEDEMDHDIMQHRWEAISRLSRSLSRSSSQMQLLDATLAMVFYNCSVCTPNDYLPDIPWSSHFRAVSSFVKKLNYAPSQFNVSLITWIDILGATMIGETPQFSHTYRTKHLSGTSSGLQQLMGCDDRVMYLISEIACLEALKREGRVDGMNIYSHVTALNSQIEWTEPMDPTLEMPFTSSGVVKPDQLAKIMSTLFRCAARIYLFSLISGFDYYDPSIVNLVASIVDVMQYLPPGPNGFDRCLVWPLFIAGANSIPRSSFRKMLTERVVALGYLGDFGSFGRMYHVLKELWRLSDDPMSPSVPGARPRQEVSSAFEHIGQLQQPAEERIHWRDVMHRNKWDYLLI